MRNRVSERAVAVRKASAAMLILVFGTTLLACVPAIPLPAFAVLDIPGGSIAGDGGDSLGRASSADAAYVAGAVPRAIDLHLEVGAQSVTYHALSETAEFNPAADLMPPASPGWWHFWREERAWVRIDHDAVKTEHLSLRPGATLGAVKAEFRAGNDSLHFSEAWETRTGLLWGVSAAAELRRRAGSGPFLHATCAYTLARSGEGDETIVSTGSKTNGQNRDAEFLWRERKASFGAGYRWRAVEATAGGVYTDLRLEKRLDYHIPETGAAFGDTAIIRALNSADSEYDFSNVGRWRPCCAFKWMISPAWAIAAGAAFGGSEDFSLAVRLSL